MFGSRNRLRTDARAGEVELKRPLARGSIAGRRELPFFCGVHAETRKISAGAVDLDIFRDDVTRTVNAYQNHDFDLPSNRCK